MPSRSVPQHNFMEAAAHNPKFAAEHHIPPAVAREFVQADTHNDSYKRHKQRVAHALTHLRDDK